MADQFQSEKDRKESIHRLSDTKVKSPKNICQVGRIGQGLVIYVEDYVKTYARQLAEEDCQNSCLAVLVGDYRTNGTEKAVYLYGLVKVDFGSNEFGDFKGSVWTTVYDDIKKYFPSSEIVGWYYGGTGLGKEDFENLKTIHMENFPGRDKVMLVFDTLEKEFNFYLFDGMNFVSKGGYYIYYERNPEMQDYMIDHKTIHQEEETVDDEIAVRRIKTVLEQKKTMAAPAKEQRMMIRLSYAAGTLMMAVLVIVTVTVMNNDRKVKDIEKSVSTLSNIFDKKEQQSSEKTTVIPTASPSPSVSTSVASPTEGTTPTPTPQESNVSKPTQEPTPVVNTSTDTLIEYIVMPGDTLASICTKQCGNAKLVNEVKALNGIENEDVIYAGQKILLPKKDE